MNLGGRANSHGLNKARQEIRTVRPKSRTAGVGQEKNRKGSRKFRGIFLKEALAITQSAFGFTQLSSSVTIHSHIARPDPKPLLRLGFLPTGYIYPKAERAIRDLLRKWSQLVRQKTANLLNVQNLLTRNTGQAMNGTQIKQLTPTTVGEFVALPEQALALQVTMAVLQHLTEQIKQVERAVHARVKLRAAFQALLTVPGIGRTLALTIMLETGEIGRFPTVGQFASYCRCVSSTKLSNGKRKGQGNTRTAINTWRGPLSKPRISPCDTTLPFNVFINARKRKRMGGGHQSRGS